MQSQLRRLADKVETLAPKAAESPQIAEKDEAVARIERQLAGLAERIERIAQPVPAAKEPAPSEAAKPQPFVERRHDARPLEELARRVEAIRAVIERQGAVRPDGAPLLAALANLNDKLDRAAVGGAQSASTMTALHGLIGRLEEALRRSATATLDPRPIEELSRRIEGVRGLVEQQSGLASKVEEITAAVGELNQKLPHAAAGAAEIERLETGLRQLSAEVRGLGRAEPVDMRPVEALGRRIEEMRKAVESQQAFQPQVERLEDALAEIRARLERPAQNPQIEAVDATLRQLAAKFEEAVNRPAPDPKLIEDLSRRIDAVRSVAERGFAPHAARLESALADIRAKVEETAARPAFDARPIEELSRRVDTVRGVAERGFAPHAARLEIRAGRHPDQGRGGRRPPGVRRRPIEELSRASTACAASPSAASPRTPRGWRRRWPTFAPSSTSRRPKSKRRCASWPPRSRRRTAGPPPSRSIPARSRNSPGASKACARASTSPRPRARRPSGWRAPSAPWPSGSTARRSSTPRASIRRWRR